MRTNRLTNEEIQRYAPSAFAGQPYHAMSDRYAFVPTSQVIDGMRSAGFEPTSGVRTMENSTFVPLHSWFDLYNIVGEEEMPKKFTADNEARRRSRETIGALPQTRIIPDKRRKPPKHRKPLKGEN